MLEPALEIRDRRQGRVVRQVDLQMACVLLLPLQHRIHGVREEQGPADQKDDQTHCEHACQRDTQVATKILSCAVEGEPQRGEDLPHRVAVPSRR
jgi:hypothetical protein